MPKRVSSSTCRVWLSTKASGQDKSPSGAELAKFRAGGPTRPSALVRSSSRDQGDQVAQALLLPQSRHPSFRCWQSISQDHSCTDAAGQLCSTSTGHAHARAGVRSHEGETARSREGPLVVLCTMHRRPRSMAGAKDGRPWIRTDGGCSRTSITLRAHRTSALCLPTAHCRRRQLHALATQPPFSDCMVATGTVALYRAQCRGRCVDGRVQIESSPWLAARLASLPGGSLAKREQLQHSVRKRQQ